MFEEIFKHKKVNFDMLTDYGFIQKDNSYIIEQEIMDGTFILLIHIDSQGLPYTNLIEKDTGEEYVLYKTNAQGTYVGDVRNAIKDALSKIADTCYETAIFKTVQAQMVINFVRDAYGDELEFLWTKFPDNAVWRRKDNNKWYGAILTVIGNKIGLDNDNVVEIIDLRMDSAKAEKILSREHYYPGWHMNKKSWYTIVLDGGISDKELKTRIQESYHLAAK